MNKTITWKKWLNERPLIDKDTLTSNLFLGIVMNKKAKSFKFICSPNLYYLDNSGVIWKTDNTALSHDYEMHFWVFVDDLVDWESIQNL